MKYKWPDTSERLSRIESELGIDRNKLEKACELAAYKIYPVYRDFSIEVGDRIPGVHYLKQVIYELAIGEISDPEDTYSWGGITVESCEFGEEEGDYYAINISYYLGSVWYDDIKK